MWWMEYQQPYIDYHVPFNLLLIDTFLQFPQVLEQRYAEKKRKPDPHTRKTTNIRDDRFVLRATAVVATAASDAAGLPDGW